LIAARLVSGIFAEFDPIQKVVPAPLFTFYIGHWPIVVTNHMFSVAAVMVLLLAIIPFAAKSKGLVPTGLRNLVESVCVFLREEMAKPVLGADTDRYISFIWTMFFFVLGLNLLKMIPTESIFFLITGKENSFGGPATADIWITGAMAVVTFFTTHILGIREQGLWRYIVNLAPPVPWWLMPLIYFLEIISALVRPFTLAIRLFANMLAGHMVIATFIGLIFVFKSYAVAGASILSIVLLSLLELLVAFIQAYIFTLLSTQYIGFSVSSEH
jgi:F-type H+-transporting ATPase subunit a